MKIAVATDGPVVAAHFGRCPEYTIFTVEDGKVVSKSVTTNPGHEPGLLPQYLGRMGVSCIIAGGMGPRAQGLFAERGIETIVGASGPVTEVIDLYLAGRLESGESLCEHGDSRHECGHEHHHENHCGHHQDHGRGHDHEQDDNGSHGRDEL